MVKPQDRMVYQKPDKTWANKRSDAGRASTVHQTQAEAAAAAKRMLGNQGGGELVIKGRDQRIRSRDTVMPGHDPASIKDQEH